MPSQRIGWVSEAQAPLNLSPEQRADLIEDIKTEQAELQEGIQTELQGEKFFSEGVSSAEIEAEVASLGKAAKAVEGIGKAEADALEAAGKITVWTKVRDSQTLCKL